MKFKMVNGCLVAEPEYDENGQDIPIVVGSPKRADGTEKIRKNSFRRTDIDQEEWDIKVATNLKFDNNFIELKDYDKSEAKDKKPLFVRSE